MPWPDLEEIAQREPGYAFEQEVQWSPCPLPRFTGWRADCCVNSLSAVRFRTTVLCMLQVRVAATPRSERPERSKCRLGGPLVGSPIDEVDRLG